MGWYTLAVRKIERSLLMARTDGYAGVARQFFQKALAALQEGDLAQASEKGWGAAAEMLKAVAERRGWRHDGHRQLFDAARRLADESGDERISELFHVANSLHTNFYEGWFSAETVRGNVESVRELMARLEPHLGAT